MPYRIKCLIPEFNRTISSLRMHIHLTSDTPGANWVLLSAVFILYIYVEISLWFATCFNAMSVGRLSHLFSCTACSVTVQVGTFKSRTARSLYHKVPFSMWMAVHAVCKGAPFKALILVFHLCILSESLWWSDWSTIGFFRQLNT